MMFFIYIAIVLFMVIPMIVSSIRIHQVVNQPVDFYHSQEMKSEIVPLLLAMLIPVCNIYVSVWVYEYFDRKEHRKGIMDKLNDAVYELFTNKNNKKDKI